MNNAVENDIEKLWDDFDQVKLNNSPDDEVYILARNALVEEYYPFVESVARNMVNKLRDITEEELSSFGVDGLFRAIERFDRKMEIQFKTFSMYRIRGAMLDNIRKADWVPRLVRRNRSQLEKIRAKFESEKGCPLTDGEMAEKMGITIEAYQEMAKGATPVGLISMDSRSRGDQDEEYDCISNIAVADAFDPLDEMLRDEMYRKLMGKNFTPLERKIIYMHYYDGLTMKEISQKVSFCESRISQMHTDIIRRLQRKIERNPEYAADLRKMLKA